MVRLPLLEDSLSEVIRLNARFANTLGRVTIEFLRDMATTLNQSPLIDFDGTRRQQTPRPDPYASHAPRHRHADPEPAPAPAPAPPAAPQQSIMLLEAEAGGTAIGFFLVQNTLAHEVSVRVQASPFVAPSAPTARPRLTFYPEPVSLAPGEQITMRALVAIDETLEPGVRYRCELTVPALPGTAIPVVVRRRRDRAAETTAAAAERSEPAEPSQEASND